MPLFDLGSGSPHHVTLTAEQAGPDLLCRLRAGDAPTGAVAVSLWSAGRARTRSLRVHDERDVDLAIHAAHRLCLASRRNVVCVAGVHRDDVAPDEMAQIVDAADAITARGARLLERQRFDGDVADPRGILARIVAAEPPVLRELAPFFAQPIEQIIDRHRPAIERARREHFGDAVHLFAPLYLGNACPNDCSYCGFRKSLRFPRTQLSPDEVVAEARQLAAHGHRSIDLVAGELATDRIVADVCLAIARIRAETDISRVNLNLGALTEEQLRRLVEAGASGYNIYQETYDPAVYFDVHRSGPKRDMAYRLDTPHRAARAGFEVIGLGVLLGLRPHLEDLARCVCHARILMQDHPGLRLGFSLPRIQPAGTEGEPVVPHPVSRADFLRALLFLRLEFPRAHLTLTTREPPALRDTMIELGVTRISAGVSTAPGGYSGVSPGAATQFDTADGRSFAEMASVIESAGLTCAAG